MKVRSILQDENLGKLGVESYRGVPNERTLCSSSGTYGSSRRA